MTASKTLSDGLYTIVSAVNNNSVFDIEWASMVDEGNLVISNRNGGNNQKFDVTYLGNGYYKIEAHHSKKALDVYNASTEPAGECAAVWLSWRNEPEMDTAKCG